MSFESKLKKEVKKEYEKENRFMPNFEALKARTFLRPSPEKKQRQPMSTGKLIAGIVSVTLAAILIIPAAAFISIFISVKTSNQRINKTYNLASENITMDKDTYKKINSVTYPDVSIKSKGVSEEYIESLNNFTYQVFEAAKTTSSNQVFSSLSLYANLLILSSLTENETAYNALSNLLGLTSEERLANYKNTYENNFFVTSSGTVQMYNGLFLTNEYNYNQTMIDNLASYYCEAYQMDFDNSNDLERMASWVNEKVQDENFMQGSDFNPNIYQAFYLLSTFYFNNSWQYRFIDSSSYDGTFYCYDGSTIKTRYMKHNYASRIYVYDDYYSVYDYYNNDLKIQYLIPSNESDQDIFTLLEDKNFLVENEENIYTSSQDPDNTSPFLTLSVPVFDTTCEIDFSSILSSLGLSTLFDEDSHSFDALFTNLSEDNSIALDYVKQKTYASFSEDGTTVKSLTISSGIGKNSAAEYSITSINLDRPFVYVIRDRNNIPLTIGQVVNPTL